MARHPIRRRSAERQSDFFDAVASGRAASGMRLPPSFWAPPVVAAHSGSAINHWVIGALRLGVGGCPEAVTLLAERTGWRRAGDKVETRACRERGAALWLQ
jgi:hypothetical protein